MAHQKTHQEESCGVTQGESFLPMEQEGEAKEKGAAASVTITADEAGMRLDRWLRKRFEGVTQGSVQKMLRKGEIRVDKHRVEADCRLAAGQVVRLPPSLAHPARSEARVAQKNTAQASKLLSLVLYEDADVVALNKPSGLAVQGGTGLKENLDDMLMALSLDGVTKPKLVHRLDRDTSGVLLIARTDFAARRLAEAFRHRETQKIYWAVTLGVPKPLQGKIEAPLVKHGELMHIADPRDPEAKKAATLFKVVENANKQAAFVALWPLTGRTHQLRVHMAHIGTPLLGDRLYAVEKETALPLGELGKGLHLHARRLIIPHPRRGMLDVTAPLTGPMLKTWRWFHFDAQADVDFSDV